MSSVSSDYERLLRAERLLEPQLERFRRTALLLVFSPAVLWMAYAAVWLVIPDQFGDDYEVAMALWTAVAIGIGWWQLASGSTAGLGVRRAALATAAAATIAGGVAYACGALVSHAGAIPAPPERTFEFHRCRGRCRMGGYFVHQRANGTTVEGEYIGPPVPYGATCATVQRLTGRFGFNWVRVLERTPPPEHQIIWPFAREDCFSNQPLARLRR